MEPIGTHKVKTHHVSLFTYCFFLVKLLGVSTQRTAVTWHFFREEKIDIQVSPRNYLNSFISLNISLKDDLKYKNFLKMLNEFLKKYNIKITENQSGIIPIFNPNKIWFKSNTSNFGNMCGCSSSFP